MSFGPFVTAFLIIIGGAVISLVINLTDFKHRLTLTSATIIVALVAVALVLLGSMGGSASPYAAPKAPQVQSTLTPDSPSAEPTAQAHTASDSPVNSNTIDSATDTQATSDTPTPTPTSVAPQPPPPPLPQYFTDVAKLVTVDDGQGYEQPNQSMSIAGTTYNHAIHEASTCQSDDGGDYWADYSVSNTWSRLTGVVGMSDTSKSQSPITWRIYLNNVVAQQGVATPGQPVKISLPMKGKYAVRLWINDARAPKVDCGFGYVGSLAWGDLTLTA